MRAKQLGGELSHMPGLYFERTTAEEQTRHHEKLGRLARQGGLLIEPFQDGDGGWHLELVTMDWDEPGLLDNIFEAILRSVHIPGGVALRRGRIFTGRQGQVVNILELTDRQGGRVGEAACALLQKELAAIRPGERGALESIEHVPFPKLIPLLAAFPTIDNDSSADYTFLEFKVEKLSNRFTCVLLHFLARSELWLNIQIAEFVQEEVGYYRFYVVDKQGHKLSDSHFTRLSVVRVLEAMNRMLMRFNVHYIRRERNHRIDKNEGTIYHSRPDPGDFLRDLENIRQLAELKGLGSRLSSLVDCGLLESKSLYLLKKVETFVNHHGGRIRKLVETGPTPEDISLCREYFELRRQSLRITMPLFDRLEEMAEVVPRLTDGQRLGALCRPSPTGAYALDPRNQLYHTAAIWLEEPIQALDAFQLMARTNCFIRDDLLDAVEASIDGWTPEYIAENLQEVGLKFQRLLEESVRQGNTATVLRNLRSVGLLQRYLPGFETIQGMVHVIPDHGYTVDEHSFILIEVLQGLELLTEVLPRAGPSMMRAEYEKLSDVMGLQKYAQKFVIEMRMLQYVVELSRNQAIKPFLQLMERVRHDSLEYLMETNVLDQSQSLCLTALVEIETIRMHLDPLARLYRSLSGEEKRNLVLAGLLHDLRKPAQDHGPLMAQELAAYLEGIGLQLPEPDVAQITWLIHHHLDIRPLISRMGSEGEKALLKFADGAGDKSRVRALILFTYADRVAVYLDPNKNAHDAMVLSDMLGILEENGGRSSRGRSSRGVKPRAENLRGRNPRGRSSSGRNPPGKPRPKRKSNQ